MDHLRRASPRLRELILATLAKSDVQAKIQTWKGFLLVQSGCYNGK